MTNPKDILIVLDPGHAKNTPGKRAGNPVFYEYLGNRRVARKLKPLLEKQGFKVKYSCNLNSPSDVSLSGRAANARNSGADVFISIHTNALNDTSVRGTETFVHTNSQASLAIAHAVQNRLVKAIGANNRGVKHANFGVLRGTYQHMLSILTEADFFTNPTARAWMFQDSFDTAYANAVLQGVCDHYGIKAKAGSTSKPKPAPTVETDDVGKSLLRVKVNGLWVYDKPDWSAKTFKVNKDEAFTIKRSLIVNGSKMYQLKSGLFITANSKYVEIDGKVTAAPKPKSSGGDAYIRGVQQFVVNYDYKIAIDGIEGPATKKGLIKVLQSELNNQFGAGLSVDGIPGPKTYAALVTVRKGAKGNITKVLQALLYIAGHNPGKLNGIFGDGTYKAVRAYQSAKGLSVDGTPGRATWTKLIG